jgi:hypothetical protein
MFGPKGQQLLNSMIELYDREVVRLERRIHDLFCATSVVYQAIHALDGVGAPSQRSSSPRSLTSIDSDLRKRCARGLDRRPASLVR